MIFLGYADATCNSGHNSVELVFSGDFQRIVLTTAITALGEGISGAEVGVMGYTSIDQRGEKIFRFMEDRPVEKAALGQLYDIADLRTSHEVTRLVSATLVVRSTSGLVRGLMLAHAM